MDIREGRSGELIHTGFRKGLDSKFSVVMWNFIRICDEKVWHNFLSRLEDEFDKIQTDRIVDVKQLKRAIASWVPDPFDDKNAKFLFTGHERHCSRVLYGLFEVMPDEDYIALTGWINYCFDVWEGKT